MHEEQINPLANTCPFGCNFFKLQVFRSPSVFFAWNEYGEVGVTVHNSMLLYKRPRCMYAELLSKPPNEHSLVCFCWHSIQIVSNLQINEFPRTVQKNVPYSVFLPSGPNASIEVTVVMHSLQIRNLRLAISESRHRFWQHLQSNISGTLMRSGASIQRHRMIGRVHPNIHWNGFVFSKGFQCVLRNARQCTGRLKAHCTPP